MSGLLSKWLEGKEPEKKAAPQPQKETSTHPPRAHPPKAHSPHPAGKTEGAPAAGGKKRRRGGRGRGGPDANRHVHPRNVARDPGAMVRKPSRHRERVAPQHVHHVPARQTGPAPFDMKDDAMRVVPIGGCEEVGRNIEAIFYKDEIVVIDCGVQFGDVSVPGVDYILPDTRVLEERKEQVKAILITHGHLDHVGALPYILPKLGFPALIGTKLTLGFARAQLEEFKMVDKVEWRTIDPAEPAFKVGKNFEIDYFRVSHSIPDACGIKVKTDAGTLVHTGDFKFDFTPADGVQCDTDKMMKIGREGVDVLMSDSTNAMKPGHTPSESKIVENLKHEIQRAEGRVIMSTFASLLGRVQHVINAAHETNRKVFVTGRSMVRNIQMAVDLGYLKVPAGLLRELKKSSSEFKKLPDDKVLVICTGSQGEELAALSRIGRGDHPDVKVKTTDTIIFSSSPIPGNESAVADVMDSLARAGGILRTNKDLDIHCSGHAYAEDCKMMINFIKPKNLTPVHGLHFMRQAHGKLGVEMGIDPKNILLLDNGDILEIKNGTVKSVEWNQNVERIFIDGLGIGDVTQATVDERVKLSENGIIVLLFKIGVDGTLAGDIEVKTSGFASTAGAEQILEKVKRTASEAFDRTKADSADAKQTTIVRTVEDLLLRELDREPVVIPLTAKI